MSAEQIVIIAFSAAAVIVLLFLATRKKRAETPPDEMDGGEFEGYCAGLLSGEGWEIVCLTAASGDYGADIIAKRGGILYAIQCKRYEKPVGVAAVQEVRAATAHYKCARAAVMTNSVFTRQAKELAAENGVELWDGEALRRLEAHKSGDFSGTGTLLIAPIIGSDGETVLLLDKKQVSCGVFAEPLTLTAEEGFHRLVLKLGFKKTSLDFFLEKGDRRVFAAGSAKNRPLLYEIGI